MLFKVCTQVIRYLLMYAGMQEYAGLCRYMQISAGINKALLLQISNVSNCRLTSSPCGYMLKYTSKHHSQFKHSSALVRLQKYLAKSASSAPSCFSTCYRLQPSPHPSIHCISRVFCPFRKFSVELFPLVSGCLLSSRASVLTGACPQSLFTQL